MSRFVDDSTAKIVAAGQCRALTTMGVVSQILNVTASSSRGGQEKFANRPPLGSNLHSPRSHLSRLESVHPPEWRMRQRAGPGQRSACIGREGGSFIRLDDPPAWAHDALGVLIDHRNHVFHRPQPIRQLGCHRRRNSERFVDAHEVVPELLTEGFGGDGVLPAWPRSPISNTCCSEGGPSGEDPIPRSG